MSCSTPDRVPCTIIGSGNVARSLSEAIRYTDDGRFYLNGVYARNRNIAAGIAGPDTKSGSIEQVAVLEGLIIIAVSDDAIRSVAETLAVIPMSPDLVCCHVSGAVGLDALQPLKAKGAEVGSVHPLQSFPADSGGAYFRDISVSILSDTSSVVLSDFAKSLDCRPVAVTEEQKQQLHLAAVFASNYLVALMDLVNKTTKGLEYPLSDLLKPLIQTTLSNIEGKGTARSLTGPVSRGDAGTVKAHLELIDSIQDHEMKQAYKTLGRAALRLAFDTGKLSKEQADELHNLLQA